jgi:hypothetical protein
MNRKERRAAADQTPATTNPVVATVPLPQPEISQARLDANRANAKLSTGPITPEGKAKVSTNAVKTALTGRTVLLPFDDQNAYHALLEQYKSEFQPVGPIESGLVQSLVDVVWRLERIPGLEYALLEIGHQKLRAEDPAFANSAPRANLELRIRATNEKGFSNLELQETRLTRRRERELKELRAHQYNRQAKQTEELQQAAQAALVAEHNAEPFKLAALGFEFSTECFDTYLARLTPSMKQNLLNIALPTAPKTAAA